MKNILEKISHRFDEAGELYKSLFINNHSIMLIIQPETGEIIDVNQSACDFYKYSKDVLCSMSIMDINILSPKEIQNEMHEAKVDHRNYFLFQHRLANGEIRDVEVYSCPIDLEGQKVLHSIIHDITERKRIEREKENLLARLEKAIKEKTAALETNQLLMKEMNHRIKNNLNMVQGLLQLQYHNLKDEHSRMVLKECAGRVRSISDIHNMLAYGGEIQMIPVSNYICKLVRDLAQNFAQDIKKVKIDCSIKDFLLDVHILVPFALIVTELVTNAFKYAFTDHKEGILDIHLESADSGKIEFVIKDNGGGFPPGFDIKKSNSLGMQIILSLVEQIRGTLNYSSDQSGLEFRILFPEKAL